jgi:hypothetical protein
MNAPRQTYRVDTCLAAAFAVPWPAVPRSATKTIQLQPASLQSVKPGICTNSQRMLPIGVIFFYSPASECESLA